MSAAFWILLIFQMAAIGPMFGQLGFFYKFAGKDIEDKRPLERYLGETKRLLGVLDKRLNGRTWIMGDEYTIADVSIVGWIRTVIGFYGARELVDYDDFKNLVTWYDRMMERAAVQRGVEIPPRI